MIPLFEKMILYKASMFQGCRVFACRGFLTNRMEEGEGEEKCSQ